MVMHRCSVDPSAHLRIEQQDYTVCATVGDTEVLLTLCKFLILIQSGSFSKQKAFNKEDILLIRGIVIAWRVCCIRSPSLLF